MCFSDKQAIVPLAFDVFGDQFDTIAERMLPKRYNLPPLNETWVTKIDGYYDTISQTYKLELLSIERNLTCGCELRFITNVGEFLTTSTYLKNSQTS